MLLLDDGCGVRFTLQPLAIVVVVVRVGRAGGVREQSTTQNPETNTPVRFWGWWLSENVQNPENERSCLFLGLVVVSSRLVEDLYGHTLPSLIPAYPGTW